VTTPPETSPPTPDPPKPADAGPAQPAGTPVNWPFGSSAFPAQGTFTNPGAAPIQFPLHAASMLQVQAWQTPYPPPEHIREYEAILPGSFDRILTMVEQAQAAQIETVRTAQANARGDSQRGNYLGAAVTVAAMAGTVVCAIYGATVVAGLFLTVPVMSVARALIESAKPKQMPLRMPPQPTPQQQTPGPRQ
jgi:uncharacterized membrane protein